MEEAVKIAVRWRPMQANDDKNGEIIVQKLAKNAIGVDEHTFVVDEVIDNFSQQEIYKNLVQPLINKAINGFNCTVLAYGQTGAGKTYTMGLESNENIEQNGIMIRAIEDLFSRPNADKFKLAISMNEIYNDRAYDLLSETPLEPLNPKGYKNSIGVKKFVKNVYEAQMVLVNCMKNRRVRTTKMNPNSSRSHAIMTIYVEVVQENNTKTMASINLVDLAGSEGVRRTSHKGVALAEGNHINQGLLCIAKVIKALSQKSKIIPYRDTVLTSVLQDSLNTRSSLTLLACISPFRKDCSQTLSTLRFAAGAKTMKITPQLNTLIIEYKKSKTPIKTLNNKRTPLNLMKTSKGLFKSPLPPNSSQKYGPRNTLNLPSTSKQSNNGIQRFSTPVTPSSKFGSATKTNGNVSKPQANSTIKSKASQTLFNESRMSNISTILSSNKDDSFGCDPMNISTSTAIIPKCDLPQSFSFSPILNRIDQMVAERLAPLITLQQSMLNSKQKPPMQPEPMRSNDEEQLNTVLEIGENGVQNENENENGIDLPISAEMTEDLSIVVNEPVVKVVDKFVRPTEMPPLRRSNRASVRLSSVKETVNEATVEKPALRRSRRISTMLENRPPVNEIVFKSPPPPAKPRKTQHFVLEQGLKQLTKSSKDDVKNSHKNFVMNILNKGLLKDLQVLPTIGSKTAYQILTYRLANGEFQQIESLKEMPFWTEKKYQRFILQNNL